MADPVPASPARLRPVADDAESGEGPPGASPAATVIDAREARRRRAVAALGSKRSPEAAPTDDSHVSDDLKRRLRAREAERRRRRLGRIAGGLAALTLLGALVWLVFFSSVLALDASGVTYEGESPYVDPAAVAEVVEAQDGTPLPRLSTGAMARRLGEVAGVESADVARDWPHSLHVTLTPREPVAVSATPDGVALLDRHGVEVATRASAPEGMPTLGMPPAPLADEVAQETTAAVLAVLADLPDDLRSRVASATATSPGAVVLTLREGTEVRWGDAEDADLKAAVLEVLITERPGRSYDVSVPERPTAR